MLKLDSEFAPYIPGKSLTECFSGDGIPILQMQHLRMLDFPISRRISYERTVDEFLEQLTTNDALRVLRGKPDMAILLDVEGALICEDGQWTLYFTPDHGEVISLPEDAPLVPILKSIFEKKVKGEICESRVPERSMKSLVSGRFPFSLLDEYCKRQKGGYLSVAERIVYEGPEELYAHVPVCHYAALSTVDLEEIENYHTIKALLEDYIYQYDHRDEELLQPLSIAVFGPAGSGKSFGVRQIAKTCDRYEVSSLNLSQYSSPVEMFAAMNEALQVLSGKIPLIFFDEFDSELNGTRRGWIKYFLAPMQDGEYTLNGRPREIDGAVFVFAGATASSFKNFLPHTPKETEAFAAIKGPDFISRLKGILNIKGPNPVSVTDRSHIIRRAILLRDLIQRKFPGIYDSTGGIVNISRGLLSAMLRVSEYRHGSRSLEFMLAMSRLSEVSRFTPSCLPLPEQLDIHIDVKDFRRKLFFEQLMGDLVEKYAQIAHEEYRKKRLADAKKRGLAGKELRAVQNEPEMASWEDLDEFYKEGHRSQIRYLGEHLMGGSGNIGIRPIVPGAVDTINELYGPVLEMLAEFEHERWMQDKLAQGWIYGELDKELKQTPQLVPYDQLDEKTKEFIRASVRDFPLYLREISYELYRKSF